MDIFDVFKGSLTTPGPPNLNSSLEFVRCEAKQNYLFDFLHISNIPACIIVLILSFFEKRTTCWPNKCGGRPKLPTAINFLDDYKNRLGYAVSFGAATNFILFLFLGTNNNFFFLNNNHTRNQLILIKT